MDTRWFPMPGARIVRQKAQHEGTKQADAQRPSIMYNIVGKVPGDEPLECQGLGLRALPGWQLHDVAVCTSATCGNRGRLSALTEGHQSSW